MNVQFWALEPTRDWPWITPHLRVLLCEDTKGIIAVDSNTDQGLAAAVFDNWTHTSAQVHLLILNKMVLRHNWFEEVADYIFNHCGLQALYGTVPSNNAAAIRLNQHLGYTEVARLKNAYKDGVDIIIMELLRENCSYVPVYDMAAEG